MEKWIACVQSNYIPWKGYFDLINLVDEFILLDDVQYTRRDWRNRNKIKTHHGMQWLTIPVKVKGMYKQLIHEVEISDQSWANKHFQSLKHNYTSSPFYPDYIDVIENIYTTASFASLSHTNHHFLIALCRLLDIKTTLSWSMDYNYNTYDVGPSERLIKLCKQAGATHYLTGPSAKSYMDTDLFAEASIEVVYMDYSGYTEYPQLFSPFEHNISILDLILNTGSDAKHFLLSFGENSIRNQ